MEVNGNPRMKVLVMHALRPTSRQTTIDHLVSFREHLPKCDVRYIHFQQAIPPDVGDPSPDLFVINYDFLNYRFTPLWPYIRRRHKEIAERAGAVVAIAQDDFWANKLLDDWCMDWNVDRILTPIDNDRDVLYPRSVSSKDFRTVLTGYVRSGNVPATSPLAERPIDLGQRVRDMPPNLGRLAQAKAEQAVTMAKAAKEAGFVVDVSTRVEDSFIGPAWSDFLSSCKFTVGMKGGASLNDPVGLIHTKVQSYLSRHPDASFDVVERRCFKGKDMKHEFTAISPRLFESAVAGTCQILRRDDYLGVLEPWRDYLPLNDNFSNISEVVSAMQDIDRCQEIADNARRALVDSGLFDYARLVESATDGFLGEPRTSDSCWSDLVSYLERAESVALTHGVALHDACAHLIAEVGLGRPSHAVRVLLNRVLRTHNGSGRAVETIVQQIRSSGLSEWFSEQLNIARHDPVAARSAWIWRPVPAHDGSSHDR
jgi:hypothetical protein